MSSSTAIAISGNNTTTYDVSATTKQFVTVIVDNQLFGIPVLTVQDVMRTPNIAQVPLARNEIHGLLNLRGRIVTAIDVRTRLKMYHTEAPANTYNVVIECGEELYSLLVDKVGDVMTLPTERFEKNPANLEPNLREVASGVYKLKTDIMIVLDVDKLLTF